MNENSIALERERKINKIRENAPKIMEGGGLRFPDGEVVNVVESVDRTGEGSAKARSAEYKKRLERKKQGEPLLDEEKEKNKKAYRMKIARYGKANAAAMMAKYDLYEGHVEKDEVPIWEKKLSLGEVQDDRGDDEAAKEGKEVEGEKEVKEKEEVGKKKGEKKEKEKKIQKKKKKKEVVVKIAVEEEKPESGDP